jgi:hypothetical protein
LLSVKSIILVDTSLPAQNPRLLSPPRDVHCKAPRGEIDRYAGNASSFCLALAGGNNSSKGFAK